jgi:hypothetical protein
MRNGKAKWGPVEAALLAVPLMAAPCAAFAQTPPIGKCPPGYEKLCNALNKPAADGGIGSAAGTGGKSTGTNRSDILENKDFQVKALGTTQMGLPKGAD